MKKSIYLGLVLLLPLILVVSGCSHEGQVDKISKEQFNELAVNALYITGFCYVGMEQEEGKLCGEADYPFIRVYNAEDFTEPGKILLVTSVTKELYEAIPDLYNEQIVFVFRDKNQQSVDRIYVKNNKWER